MSDTKALEERVIQFRTLSLPGQPMSMHMGTSYLVNDLWHEVQKLRAENAEMREAMRDARRTMEFPVDDDDCQMWIEKYAAVLAKYPEVKK